MNEHPQIGVYFPNNKLMRVYYDPDSREVYYVDKQGGAYILTGIDLDTTAPIDCRAVALDAVRKKLPVGFCGIVYDNRYAWLLGKDGTACVVPSHSLYSSPRLTVAYTDNMEYKPKEN